VEDEASASPRCYLLNDELISASPPVFARSRQMQAMGIQNVISVDFYLCGLCGFLRIFHDSPLYV